jgi:hypothetical protein
VVEDLDVEATERAQIQLIRELSEKYMMGMTDYTPEKEATMSWVEYKAKHPEFVGQYSWPKVEKAVHTTASKVGEDRTPYPLRTQ